jgi:GWxTD domain-containing protein
MKKGIVYFIALLFIPVACSTPKKTVTPSVINLSKMYNPMNSKFHPVYTVYNNSPGTSLLLVKIFPVELLYSGIIEPNKLLAQVRLTYVLSDLTDIENPAIADSGQVLYNFSRENADKRFITQIELKTAPGKQYQLMVTARDMVRNEENLYYLYIDKNSTLSSQNFLVKESDGGTPYFQPFVVANSVFKIDYANPAPSDTIYVKYYGKELPLPKPSFSLAAEKELLEQPDSIWILPFKRGVNYQLNHPGVYHFQLDTNKAEGLTMLNFGEHFPKVEDVKEMIEPLAYLTTTPEFDAIKKAPNQKLAVDNFWIERTGNNDRARELIRVYYTRVLFANYYFTSYKPGWKTDRGMIFIIYGPPQAVKESGNQERWIYYKNNFSTTVTFTFDHISSPYATNNFVLQRADNYDSYWRQAVETWRKGNIFMIE